MSNPVILCEGLCKSYKKNQPVIEHLDFRLETGKIMGLLGPNGCGKSTLLKLITGLLISDGGSIEICGIKRSEQTNKLISYLPERPYFSSKMTVEEMIAFFKDFYEDFDEVTARKMLKDMSIDTKSQLKTLSKGTKEKVQLILVMSRRAKLFLLDEPIGGVDPAARDYILRTIIGNYSENASVIITTHLISDIEPIIDDFAFMKDGKIFMSGIADEIRENTGKSLDEIFREVFKC